MKKILAATTAILIGHSALADDTEIYGASEIDLDNRVNSNVLFIMDTSGSMGGQVLITNVPYDNDVTYPGSYDPNDFYYKTYHSPNDGIPKSQLESAYSSGCSDEAETLKEEGKVLGNFRQWRRGKWQNLQAGLNSYVRCDRGNSYWLYSGNYMNWYSDPTNVTNSTRMEVTVDVVKQLTRSLSNINLGLMRFDQNSDGGMIDVPVSDISTSGAAIRDKLDDYYPQGGTPLEETMYEAARYYRGQNWMFGNDSKPNSSIATSRTDSSSAQYETPITATCQKNHIILLTDGEPTNDTSANDDIRSAISGMTLPQGLSSGCSGNGECLDELAYWLRNTDHSSSLVGDQAITTYTIGGFDLANGVELLKRTANWGGGQYYEANDTTGLTNALESIFLDILATDSTFTAPAVSVNAFNASEHRDELFYALFRPDDNAKWAGNLKKYRLTQDGFVYDKNNTPAISEATGFFNDSAKDYWNNTNISDGKNVTLGGMSNLIDPASRRLYTEDSANFLLTFENGATAETLDMTGETADNVTKLKNWIRGYDVDDTDGDRSVTDSRVSIGDPLHSEPVVVTYGGTDESPDSTIYFGTNEGFIHAISTETGQEQFAFIPKELHSTQRIFYENTGSAGDRPYGMDGPITTWMKDVNNNNLILNGGSVEPGEHVYLYAGMRRGGRNYYALDVTNRNSPRMLFKIEGGTGDFAKLGQTWSRMTVAKVKYNGQARFVAFFAGGYDTNQDGNDVREDDSMGNAIYMVDAETGKRLWWASNSGADTNISDMKNSMPASISAVDIDGDGLVDYFFAADMGGRVFRLDINPTNSGANNFAEGAMIADLSTSNKSGNRRFYNKPNVSLVKDKQYGDFLTIAIGSGHRAHPIFTTEVENRMYVLKDQSPYGKPTTYRLLTEAPEGKTSLSAGEKADRGLVYNATPLMKGTASESDYRAIMDNGGGWYVTFDTEGEKVLAEATTFAGVVIFTTFSPTGSTSSACGPDTGSSRIYALDQRFANAAIDLDNDGKTDDDDASKVLSHSGIAPRPVVIYRKGGGKSIAIGTETIDDDRFEENQDPDCEQKGTCDDEIKKCESNNCYVVPTYWRQNHKNE